MGKAILQGLAANALWAALVAAWTFLVAAFGGFTWGEVGTITAGGAAIFLFIAALIGMRQARVLPMLEPLGPFHDVSVFRAPDGRLVGLDVGGAKIHASLDKSQRNRVWLAIAESLRHDAARVVFVEREIYQWSR